MKLLPAAFVSLMVTFIAALPTTAAAQQVVRIPGYNEAASSDTSSGSMTADGRFVLFSTSQSLVPDDTNNASDAYLRDMQDGTVTRVSVAPNGSQIPEGAFGSAMSSDGRFVLLGSGISLAPQAPTSCTFQGTVVARSCSHYYVLDRQTHAVTLVSQSTDGTAGNGDIGTASMSDDGRFVLFTSYATNLAPSTLSPAQLYGLFLRDRVAGTTTAVTLPNVGPAGAFLQDAIISRDGNSILYSYRYSLNPPPQDLCPSPTACSLTAAAVMDRSTGSAQILNVPRPVELPGTINSIKVADLSPDGRFVLLFRSVASDDPTRSGHAEFLFHDRQESRTVALAGCCDFDGVNLWAKLRADGRQVVYQQVLPSPSGGRPTLRLYDDRSHQSFELAGASIFPSPSSLEAWRIGVGPVHFSADGSRVTFTANGNIANLNQSTQTSQLYAFKIDTDGDGIPDGWETQFGLNPNDANDANADADGDGVTNLQEYLAGTHPHALFTRYLAEGVSNAVFSTRLALVNPGATPAAVMLRYQNPFGGIAAPTFTTTIPPLTRITIDPAPAGVDAGDFSTVVESDALVVVDRTTSVHGVGHGSATETAIVQPSTTWYFAEGATGGPFSLFYQLQNPGAVAAQVSVTYLLPAPQPPLTKAYTVAPHSRFTIFVDQEDPLLASADVSARILSDQPIIAERAMYLDSLNQPLGGVIGGAGVTAPATHWFFAEGATGVFFDLYVLIGNPQTTDANVSLTYLLPDGTHFTKTYLATAQSRLTILVDQEDPRLKDTPVSVVVESTNNVPIVVERTMWWPEGHWYEGHLSVASSVTSKKWALAEGEIGTPRQVQTYIEIANTSPTAGVATIHWLADGDVGSTATLTVPLAANSRTNVPVSVNMLPLSCRLGCRFGAVVESDGVDLIVERSMYWDVNFVVWAAGTNALGTPIP